MSGDEEEDAWPAAEQAAPAAAAAAEEDAGEKKTEKGGVETFGAAVGVARAGTGALAKVTFVGEPNSFRAARAERGSGALRAEDGVRWRPLLRVPVPPAAAAEPAPWRRGVSSILTSSSGPDLEARGVSSI